MLCTFYKYIFLAILEEPASILPLTIILISPNGALGLSSTRRLGSGSFSGFSLPLTNCCGFSCLMKASICYFR